jgi:large subunit ribosomal protein L28
LKYFPFFRLFFLQFRRLSSIEGNCTACVEDVPCLIAFPPLCFQACAANFQKILSAEIYGRKTMSKECAFCGKRPEVGNYVSHSHHQTKRRFNPNLQNVRHQFADGRVATISVCTRCLRSGLVVKPAARKAVKG